MTTGDRAAVAAHAAALLTGHLKPRWQPLPHQVPPQGDWAGWALIAGRGAGKTDACAYYIDRHINGPPCLDGPVPHWVGIIAPTLGDAATSCYAGPSGIRAHSPGAKLTNGPGGLTVRWPNGSEAKLFGAHTPEDVERLRSGGNRCSVWCCSEGTSVETEHGPVPIEDIRAGDRVWTREGLRRVKAAALTRRRAETLVIRTVDGHRLELTPDHKVWVVGHGWVEAQNVTPGCTMLAWNYSPQGLPPGTTGKTSGGVARVRATTRATTATSSIVNCGELLSALWTTTRCFTTPTTTKQTTRSAISGQSPVQSTVLSLLRSRSTRTGSACRPAKPVVSTFVSSGAIVNRAMSHVLGAGLSFSSQGCGPNPVAVPAVRETAVRSIEPSLTRPDTYDLEIDGEPEFFADGLLIHNCEELSAWRYLEDAWDHMRFGLRVGPRPHWVASTTPKPKNLIKRLVAGEERNVVLTTASTYDNPHLEQHIRDALEETYGSTQLGQQELLGLILDADENALWRRSTLDETRVRPDEVPDLIRVTVGVDPSGGAGEQGIVVVGKSDLVLPGDGGRPQHHGYVLDDRSCKLPPDQWGRRAVQAAIDWDADDLVVERNFGGDMCVATLRTAAEALGVDIPIRTVTASRGKRVRAQPVAALSAQGRWHMAGVFPELEDQMATWYEELGWSPDRLDAMAWPAWHLKLVGTAARGQGSMSSSLAGKQITGERLR